MKRQITPFEAQAHDIQYRKRDKREGNLVSEPTVKSELLTYIIVFIVSAIVAVGIIGVSVWTH